MSVPLLKRTRRRVPQENPGTRIRLLCLAAKEDWVQMKPIVISFAWCLLVLLPTLAAGQGVGRPSVHSYGILVGSNTPGKHQEVLRFAHQDARRLEAVLTKLGDYDPDNLILLNDPDGEALSEMDDIIADHARRSQPKSGRAGVRELPQGADLPSDCFPKFFNRLLKNCKHSSLCRK